MKVIEIEADFAPLAQIRKRCVLTIGNFDGVHIGHQEIIAVAAELADQKQADLVAMTFEPHPVAALYPDKAPPVLTPLPLKERLLRSLGVDCLVVLKSTAEMLSLSATEFVDQFLIETMAPAVFVEGEDFNFGRARSGNVHTLGSLASARNFQVRIVEPKNARLSIGPSVRVSSTLIRQMIADGKMADADLAMARPYRLIGKVIPGRGKGRQLGFPTLNMVQPEQLIPAHGVYAGTVELAYSYKQCCLPERHIPAVFSIGQTATFGQDHPLLIEAHLLIENVDDLPKEFMAMDFIDHIRNQKKFDTEKALAAQIKIDCQKAREILGS